MTAPTLGEAAGLLRVLPVPAAVPAGSLHLVERHARVYRHTWLMLVSGLLEPLFYLLSIGVGLGQLVGTVTGPAASRSATPRSWRRRCWPPRR